MTGEQLADLQLTHPPDNSEAAAAGDEAAEAPADANGVPSSTGESSGQLPNASEPGAAAASEAGAAVQGYNDAAAVAGASQPSEQAGAIDAAADVDADADADVEELEITGSACQQPLCPAITTLTTSPKR